MKRVKLTAPLAPADIPVGTLGTVLEQREHTALVAWDNGYVLRMYGGEIEEEGE